MNLPTVGELWREYWDHIRPPGAVSPIQVQETRRAFYAGVFAMLTTMKGTIGAEEVSEEQGVEYLSALHEECEKFYELVKRNKA